MLGNEAFSPNRIAGARLSTFLDCGSGAVTRPYADQYQVTMFLMTRVQDGGDGASRVRTELDAYARSRSVSGNQIHCTTRGILERKIWEAITEALGT
jgi:hypothetical protein